MEANHLFSPSSCLRLLNLELIRKKPQNVTLIDMDYYASYFGKRKWFDDKNYFLRQTGFFIRSIQPDRVCIFKDSFQ